MSTFQESEIHVTYVEIYNDTLYDLFKPDSQVDLRTNPGKDAGSDPKHVVDHFALRRHYLLPQYKPTSGDDS